MTSFKPLLLASVLLSLPFAATADVLLIDVIEQAPANNSQGLPRPAGGETMEQVRSRFGSPEQESPQVGDPPITRWVYGQFTVYFEYDRVITSVVHR